MSMAENGTILLAGASRGLGLGLAHAYLEQGWQVIATARDPSSADGLRALGATHRENLLLEKLDITSAGDIRALAGVLSGKKLDVLFVVAGIHIEQDTPIADVPAEAASMEFLTNAIGPVSLGERLAGLMAPGGAFVFMTSLLGSIASNAGGSVDLYRASKSALNMLGSCFALRHRNNPVILLHPGWVRTEMGGAQAPLDIETSVRGMISVIAGRRGKPGLAYLDYQGKSLPW
jgi:NAD(P)-dependent dehydrogenase (short-subunit alcohol dehydrogenase family)